MSPIEEEEESISKLKLENGNNKYWMQNVSK